MAGTTKTAKKSDRGQRRVDRPGGSGAPLGGRKARDHATSEIIRAAERAGEPTIVMVFRLQRDGSVALHRQAEQFPLGDDALSRLREVFEIEVAKLMGERKLGTVRGPVG